MTNVGKGHIERLPSGSYRVRVYAGTDPLTGKEIRLKATAKTAEHAQAELPSRHSRVDALMIVHEMGVNRIAASRCPLAPWARSMPSCLALSLPGCGGNG